MGQGRFLEGNHILRTDKVSFDGKEELSPAPTPLSGSKVLEQLQGISIIFGKKRRWEDNVILPYKWKKRSIFFNLLYWESLLLRHNLDVMHIEKNTMGIRRMLYRTSRVPNKTYLPPTSFTMSSKEKEVFLKVLESIKVPDEYAYSISRSVHLPTRNISGLKSHDCHILVQQLLPLALRSILPKNVSSILIELSFFDIMMHLPVHLAEEAKIGGQVHYCWMYPIERYFEGVETKFNRPVRNDDDGVRESEEGFAIFSQIGRGVGESKMFELDRTTFMQAHRYVLFNCDVVRPYLKNHLETIRRRCPRARTMDIERIHNEEFPNWFNTHVKELHRKRYEQVSEKLRWLAGYPLNVARRYKGFNINGFRFHTKDRERNRKTQNSGVVVTAKTSSFSSARDMNLVEGDITYYGVLTDIIELNYYGHLKALLFKCDWVDVVSGRGIKKYYFGFMLVNLTRQAFKNEPFVPASQAEQVFYVQGNLNNKDWHLVLKNKPRKLFEMHGGNVETYVQSEPLQDQTLEDIISPGDGNVTLERTDILGMEIDIPFELTQATENDQGNDVESEDSDEEDGANA
ncbi:uncharacterized protein LOC143880718 [Tasmannia lanceolata]|uniref:uncharacterized protein LOC143880718 n=1 Tax=Tasmannia lanceolata TaxID=3420 RepID=UPI004062AF55